LKSHANDKAEISGRILCTELELNPKVLQCFDVITTYNYGGDAMVGWIPFVKLISIFILRKEVFEMRLDFIFKFLNLQTSSITKKADGEITDGKILYDLTKMSHLADKVQKFQFFRKETLTVDADIQLLWDTVRLAMIESINYIWKPNGE